MNTIKDSKGSYWKVNQQEGDKNEDLDQDGWMTLNWTSRKWM